MLVLLGHGCSSNIREHVGQVDAKDAADEAADEDEAEEEQCSGFPSPDSLKTSFRISSFAHSHAVLFISRA